MRFTPSPIGDNTVAVPFQPSPAAVEQHSAQAIRDGMAQAYQPIIRAFLVPVILFYVVVSVPHLMLRAPADAALLFSLSVLTVAVAAHFRRLLSRAPASFARLELINLIVLMLIYANTCAVLYVDFHPVNLIYFLLLMNLASTAGISIRVVAGVSSITLATMVTLAHALGREVFFYYSFVSLAGAFSAIGMSILMRGAMLRAVMARMTADRLRERAEHQADYDALTGLPNRRHFLASLEALVSGETPQSSAYVGIIDLDGFKPVNDLYGHAVGDELLVEVGRRVRASSAGDCLVARLGGDEFALLIDGNLPEGVLLRIGQRICDVLSQPFVISGIGVSVSASIGFAHFPTNGSTLRQVYERADHALYRAKRDARGGVVVFSAAHEAEMSDVGRIEQTLRTADLERELFVLFQPQHDLMTGRTSGFEALARWQSSSLGAVRPGLFIAVAERGGLIEQMTGILLRKALAAAATWPDTVSLSFNLSALDLVSSRSMANIVQIVADSGIDPARLTFELTETAVMGDFERARASLKVLADLGCRIALDDFGSGYSSFAYIHRFPLHRIKTDRSFVTRLHEDEAVGRNIIRAIADLSANLGLECLAEGVETEAELRAVQGAGIRFVQGFLYGKSMTALEAAAHLAKEDHGAATRETA